MLEKPWVRAASVAAGLFAIFYLCYQIFFAGSSSVNTEAALYYTSNDSINATGYIIRDEKLIVDGQNGVLSYVLADGDRVANGGTVAKVYSDAGAAQTQAQIDSLQSQLHILESITGMNGSSVTDLDQVSRIVEDSLTAAIMSAAYGDMGGSHAAVDGLFTAINRKLIVTDGTVDLSATIASVKAEIASLSASMSGDGRAVKSDMAGYFVSQVDGYETVLTFDSIDELTPDTLNSLSPAALPDGCVGKTVGEVDWYIAVAVDMKESLRFKEGQKLSVQMPLSTMSKLPVTVERINKSSVTGDAVLILKCNYMNGELSCIRTQPTEVILSSCSGLRISSAAVRTVDGQKGVYILRGTQLKFVPIKLLYTGNGFIVCEMSEESDGLRLYDDVVVGGKDLYDGKVVK